MTYGLTGGNTVTASNVSGCSCSGAVYEVAYTVNLKATAKEGKVATEPFFEIESVNARVATFE
jgi:hypothetical protein